MRRVIAILEDNPQRTAAMRQALSEVAAEFEHHFFDNAPDMIEWLERHLDDIALLSLDHDLGSNRTREGKVFDPGTGRDVAECLASRPCSCPVMIHSNNYPAVLGMSRVLEDGGWKVSCVVPDGDLEWIGGAWGPAIRKILLRESVDKLPGH